MTDEVKIISRTYRKIKGKYYGRVRYKIDDGKPFDILRQVENKSAIKPKQAEIEVELLKNGPAQLVAGKLQSYLGSIAKQGDIILPIELCVIRNGETFKQWIARAKQCTSNLPGRQAVGH
jgi:hypothetical protein